MFDTVSDFFLPFKSEESFELIYTPSRLINKMKKICLFRLGWPEQIYPQWKNIKFREDFKLHLTCNKLMLM